jgi:hypothetical protein
MAANESTKPEDLSRIPVAYLILGYENNRNAIISFYRNAKTMVSGVTDEVQEPVSSKIDWLLKEISAARQRGVKFRTITDITRDNLPDCKKIMAKIDELRHVSGIGVNFGVSDTESIAIVPSPGTREEHNIQFIHSDSESVVAYKRRCFDLLWDRAMPAQSRIDELEGKTAEGKVATEERARTVIDRIYVCVECNRTFLYSFEAEDHKKATGHDNIREYPIV